MAEPTLIISTVMVQKKGWRIVVTLLMMLSIVSSLKKMLDSSVQVCT